MQVYLIIIRYMIIFYPFSKFINGCLLHWQLTWACFCPTRLLTSYEVQPYFPKRINTHFYFNNFFLQAQMFQHFCIFRARKA